MKYVSYKAYDMGGVEVYVQMRYCDAAAAAARQKCIREEVEKQVGPVPFKYTLWRPEDYGYGEIRALDAREHLPQARAVDVPSMFASDFWGSVRAIAHPLVYERYKTQHDDASRAWDRMQAIRSAAAALNRLIMSGYSHQTLKEFYGRDLQESIVTNGSNIMLDASEAALQFYAEKAVEIKEAAREYCKFMVSKEVQ